MNIDDNSVKLIFFGFVPLYSICLLHVKSIDIRRGIYVAVVSFFAGFFLLFGKDLTEVSFASFKIKKSLEQSSNVLCEISNVRDQSKKQLEVIYSEQRTELLKSIIKNNSNQYVGMDEKALKEYEKSLKIEENVLLNKRNELVEIEEKNKLCQ
jgi:hypothetical protein